MNPFKKKKDDSGHQAIILDTCALIDGRIVEIVRAGFVPQTIVIPQFVIAELQFLADKGDSHKRERARYGLDVIRVLQDLRSTDVTIGREQFKNIKEVDDKLIALAKQYGHGAMLYTTDYNLNKVAQIEGVFVLNVNELAQALRPNWLPGERVEIKVIQVGQDNRQGVGYLEDGTMVVIEDGGRKVGQKVLVECKRMLQTQAGKMMFATLVNGAKVAHKKPQAEQKPVPQPQAQQSTHPQQEQTKTKPPVNKAARRRNSAQHQRPQSSQKQVYHANRRRQTPEDSLLKAIEQSK